MSIYVAGPVPRLKGVGKDDRIRDFYRLLGELAKIHGIQIQFPYPDSKIDELEPRKFYSAIENRIQGHGAVISVLAEGEESVPVEASIASQAQLPILLLGFDRSIALPRLVTGLPSVARIVESWKSDKMDDLARVAIEDFMKRYG